MAFKLASIEYFWGKALLTQTTENGGTAEAPLELKFKRLDLDARAERARNMGGDIYKKALLESDSKDELESKLQKEMIRDGRLERTAAELTDELLEIVLDWRDVKDAENAPVPFSRDGLLLVVQNFNGAYDAINAAFDAGFKAKEKN